MPDTSMRTAVWKGLNRMPYIGDGEMRDMKNLSSDAYPFITTRKGRKPYTFTTYIPATPGDGYTADVTNLPEPCQEEQGNIYKIVTDEAAQQYVSEAFYYYDSASATWVNGIKDGTFLGVVSETVAATGYGQTLYDSGFRLDKVPITYIESCMGAKVKYMGEDFSGEIHGREQKYVFGKTYIYCIDTIYEWKAYGSLPQTACQYVSAVPPTANENTLGKYWYDTSSGYSYICQASYQGYWEETEDCYEPVSAMPENPVDGMQVRYFNASPVLEEKYYCCEMDISAANTVYYYSTSSEAAEYTETTFLPVASEETYKSVYKYTGAVNEEFAECVYMEGTYIWQEIKQPKVARIVNLKDYIDNYDGSGISEILEIGAFNGNIAVLLIDGSGNTKLYYNQKLWPVSNITNKSGKKLTVVGNRLIVGESGCYLYVNSGGETSFFRSGSSFAASITANYAEYGNGGGKFVYSSITGNSESGKATFRIVSQGEKGTGYDIVYSGLSVVGTDFSVSFYDKTYYLSVENISYEKNKEIGGYTVGSTVYTQYADILTINASGVKEDFEWNNTGTGFPLTLTFTSTEPHYFDVVAWKKRLWGYERNILFGTVADIFDSSGLVDWNTGDNTYTEAISQPLWQGGNVTGIAALMNGLLCFKEDCLTIVTGNYPAIMSSSTIECRGLPPENRRSIAVANECVYYLSTDGVYRYGGGIPECISRDVKIKGTEAVGASDGNKYWLSLKEESGEYALYVYDIKRQMWHKEDNTNAISFTMLDGEMYMATGTEIFNLNAQQEENTEWLCELWYDEGTHRKKKYKEFYIRGNVGECEMFLKADEGEWKLVKAVEGKLQIRIPPLECEELGIMLRGKGICEIKSIDRVFEVEK